MTLESMIEQLQSEINHAKKTLSWHTAGWQLDEIKDDIEHMEEQKAVLVATKEKIDKLESHE